LPVYNPLKASGTSPNAFKTTASANSPLPGSPVRLNATAPIWSLSASHPLSASYRSVRAGTFAGLARLEAVVANAEGQGYVEGDVSDGRFT
jgi:hypothetical protein